MVEPALRIGILGTARVVRDGLVKPAQATPGVTVTAVASRSIERARAFASAHSLERAVGSYEALIDDDRVDAVYIALPSALHEEWVRRALVAGKHVLCEKPLAANARAAEALASCARAQKRVLHEGMHVRHMRRLARQRELVAAGELGRLVRIDSCFRHPRVPMLPGDFRLSFALGGGAGLDLGCYAAACLRYVAGEGGEVTSVRYRLASPDVDRWMKADAAARLGRPRDVRVRLSRLVLVPLRRARSMRAGLDQVGPGRARVPA